MYIGADQGENLPTIIPCEISQLYNFLESLKMDVFLFPYVLLNYLLIEGFPFLLISHNTDYPITVCMHLP